MSTMLKSAAMSLLSKTLQTFLSKYLSDVDVEGVALPSVYDGSGWGVRLSNVKLREGVQLMEQMPGKEIRKRKRSKKNRKQKVAPPTSVQLDEADHLEDMSLPQQSFHNYECGFPVESNTPSQRENHDDDDFQDVSLHLNDMSHYRASRSRTNSYDDLRVPVDDDEQPTSPPSRPSTPLQDSKSIFSCFTKGREKRNNATENENNNSTIRTMPEFSGEGEGDDVYSEPPVTVVEENSMYRQVSALAMDEKKEAAHVDGSWKNGVTIEPDESDDEDEYEDFEQSYKLCLGDNGRIGTLDIRLVDKELHIMVEDAMLTIEAFPISNPTQDDETDGGAQDNERLKPFTDDTGSAATSGMNSAAAPVPPKPKAKVPKAEPKRVTVGDRVLADNPLARAFAAIPRLFLRDIRIRFIIRKEERVQRTGERQSETAENPSANQPGKGDTMLELGIEFLSVSGGEDVLSQFQDRPEDESKHGEDQNVGQSATQPVPTVSPLGNPVDNNEYIVRHIRTGRGPTAGIWVQVFAPRPILPVKATGGNFSWAQQHWDLATQFHLFRCSGLDVRARIHLGAKKQVSSYSWFYDYEEDSSAEYDAYDDYTLDTMFVGFDTIAPGPQLPLPPMHPDTMSRGDTPIKANPMGATSTSTTTVADPTLDPPPAMHPGADLYTTDVNGIQSCKVQSTFHRISRGLFPGSCKDCSHLPSENCSKCWETTIGVKHESALDEYMPMPGLTLQITLRDPLEINVDRSSLETIHLLKTLFVRKQEEVVDSSLPVSIKEQGLNNETITTSRQPSGMDESTKSTSSFFGFLSSKTNKLEKEQSPTESFSQIMQPENLQVIGVHLSEAMLRIHVMKDDSATDGGLSFCYWDLLASCLTIDYQSLKAEGKTSQDMRFDVGRILLDEHRGVECNRLASLGILPYSPEEHESSNIIHQMNNVVNDQYQNTFLWPSTACSLLNIPPPLETLRYKDRKSHGVQLRFISVRNPKDATDVARSLVNVRLGITTTNVPWGFWRILNSVRKQVTYGIVGKPKEGEEAVPQEQRSVTSARNSTTMRSIMTYSVQIDGGTITMDPVIDIKMPLSRFAGERSSEAGISFETILEKLQVTYGKKTPTKKEVLSLQQLALLPESARTRILLCLDDLRPLEQALDVKKESNAFKRTVAVNKGILKMAKRVSRATRSARRDIGRLSNEGRTRRQQIMSELMKLDDLELNELWALHRRHLKKKIIKKRGGTDNTHLVDSTT